MLLINVERSKLLITGDMDYMDFQELDTICWKNVCSNIFFARFCLQTSWKKKKNSKNHNN